MNAMFSPEQFPSPASLVRGAWAPILFTPNPDSPERLVMAVAAVNGSDFHVAAADSAKRLACLYGSGAATALMVQQASVEALRDDLAARGRVALEEPVGAFSGVNVGPVREGEATSMRELAAFWLASISSLHHARDQSSEQQDEATIAAVATMEAQVANDRLPILVYRAVEEAEPQLAPYFSSEIRSRAKRWHRSSPQQIFIGYAGSKVVANFATLKPSRPRALIDHIKRLMWDLARHRDEEAGLISTAREYEMIVYRRDENDPEYDDRKGVDLEEMVAGLQEQGRVDDILVQPRSSVPSIATHILTRERATSAA